MRKFELFDKVEFTPEGEETTSLGCIVGFETDEKNGVVIANENGAVVEPQEHSYIVLVGEVIDYDVILAEYLESELKKTE